jgi:ankyrin repeat protein
MSPFSRIPYEVFLYIARELDIAGLYSWTLSAKPFHRIVLPRLYCRAVEIDKDQHGWPYHLLRAGMLGNSAAFMAMLEMTSLAEIDGAIIDATEIPYPRRSSRRIWPLQILQTSMLNIVCQMFKLGLIEAMLKKGVSTSVFDADGYSPLHLAVRCNSLAVIRLLLEAGADINIRRPYHIDEMTPLHCAITRNCTAAAELLIDEGADPSARASLIFKSPLDEAAYTGNHIILNRLLDIGSYDRESLTRALEYAAGCGTVLGPRNPLTMKYLLDAGAIPSNKALREACEWGHIHGIRYLLEYGVPVCGSNERGLNALHFARDCEVARVILEVAPELANATSQEGWTPLDRLYLGHRDWHAVTSKTSNPDVQLAMLLIKHGSDAKGSLGPANPGLNTVHSASRFAHATVVKAVLERQKSLIESKDSDGNTPLHWAVCSGAEDVLDCVKALVELGCDVNARDNYGGNALHLLCDRTIRYPAPMGRALALYLVSAGVDSSALWGNQDHCYPRLATPLIKALVSGRIDLALVLIDAGCDVQTQSLKLGTPLHVAAGKGYINVVQRLLMPDIDIDLADPTLNGDTALHYAVHWHERSISSPSRKRTTLLGYILLGYSLPERTGIQGVPTSKLPDGVDHVATVKALCGHRSSPDLVDLKNKHGESALDLVKAAAPNVPWDEVAAVARTARETGQPMPEVPEPLLAGRYL